MFRIEAWLRVTGTSILLSVYFFLEVFLDILLYHFVKQILMVNTSRKFYIIKYKKSMFCHATINKAQFAVKIGIKKKYQISLWNC